MVIKNTPESNFVMVSKKFLFDKSLKLSDRGLLITLLGFPKDWQFSINGLTSILPDGRDAIQASIKRL